MIIENDIKVFLKYMRKIQQVLQDIVQKENRKRRGGEKILNCYCLLLSQIFMKSYMYLEGVS